MTANVANTAIDDLLDNGNQWAAGIKDRFTNLTSEEAAFVRHIYSRHELWNLPALRKSTWNEDNQAYLERESWACELVRLAVAQTAKTGWLHDQSDMSAHQPYVRSTPTRELGTYFLLAASHLGAGDVAARDIAEVVGQLDTIIRTDHFPTKPDTPAKNALGAAALTALGDLQAADTLWALHRDLPTSSYYRDHLLRVGKKVADRLAIPEELYAERTVPTYGLDADRALRFGPPGQRSVPWADAPFEATIALDAEGSVTVTWIDDGKQKPTTSPFRSPNGLKTKYTPDSVKGVQDMAKDIVKTMDAERARLNTLPSSGRTWPFAEWAAFYRDHPVTSVAASGLVWEFEAEPGRWELALAHVGNTFQVAGGTVAEVKDDTTVRPWNRDYASDAKLQAAAELIAQDMAE